MISSKTKLCLILASIAYGQQAYAWIPCQLICDANCMGLSFDIGTMNAQIAFETVTANTNILATSISQSTAAMAALSAGVEASLTTAATNLNNTINVDTPLMPSLTSRVVKAIDGMTINTKSAIDEHSEVLANNALELSNGITQAFKTSAELERKRISKENSSNVFDALAQNAYEINSHLTSKQENLVQMLERSAALDRGIKSQVKGVGEIKSKSMIEASEIFEDMMFSLAAPDKTDSWEYTPLIAKSPASLSLLSTDYSSIGKTKEYRVLDSQRIFSGSEIDLQALILNKSQRRNLYLYEVMQGANFSTGVSDE